ncbi:MAG: AzlD domain-containing protein [Burkholderiaceae bacterium]
MDAMNLHTVAIIIGLALVTLLTRSFFLISNKPWHMPHWLQRGLQYAPIAALAAVVLPEVLVTQGQLIDNLRDARLYAALVGAVAYFWRKDVLITIVAGMVVYLPLHILLGW